MLLAWGLFGGSHLLLSWPPVRQRLCKRIGDTAFIASYAGLAATSMLLLAIVAARVGGDGPAALNLSALPAAKWGLGTVVFFGTALAMAGLAGYPKSAIARLARRMRAAGDARRQPLPGPTAIERIARHPFFLGLAVMMAAHALLATTLPMAIFFAGFALLALVGIPMQDRKLRIRHGTVYDEFTDATSVVPFASKQRSTVAGALRVLATGFLGATLVWVLHPIWQSGNGAWFAVSVALGGLFATFRQASRAKPPPASPPAETDGGVS